jgi:glycolate oxidase FAD binding subunit
MKNGRIVRIGEFIQSHALILPNGGRTKTALQPTNGVSTLNMSEVKGVIEYEPSEYAFTAYAGTRLDEINLMLAENNQFLPFDPLFNKSGGTLGGTVATNMNGPGSYRYGGIRDFVLGIKFFDDQARLIHSGGKVVKNAAGFDISKLMVGSLGHFGTIVELSLKVFPRPPEYATATSNYPTIGSAMESVKRLASSPIEIFCLDLEPNENGYLVLIRLGGMRAGFDDRIERMNYFINDLEIVESNKELNYWRDIQEFKWLPKNSLLIKIPITPKDVSKIEHFLKENESVHRYSVGANVCWVAWQKSLDSLDQFLMQENLSGLTILGSTNKTRLGASKTGEFYQRVKDALDPSGKWAKV